MVDRDGSKVGFWAICADIKTPRYEHRFYMKEPARNTSVVEWAYLDAEAHLFHANSAEEAIAELKQVLGRRKLQWGTPEADEYIFDSLKRIAVVSMRLNVIRLIPHVAVSYNVMIPSGRPQEETQHVEYRDRPRNVSPPPREISTPKPKIAVVEPKPKIAVVEDRLAMIKRIAERQRGLSEQTDSWPDVNIDRIHEE